MAFVSESVEVVHFNAEDRVTLKLFLVESLELWQDVHRFSIFRTTAGDELGRYRFNVVRRVLLMRRRLDRQLQLVAIAIDQVSNVLQVVVEKVIKLVLKLGQFLLPHFLARILYSLKKRLVTLFSNEVV